MKAAWDNVDSSVCCTAKPAHCAAVNSFVMAGAGAGVGVGAEVRQGRGRARGRDRGRARGMDKGTD